MGSSQKLNFPLPFSDERIRIMQGFHGPFSHNARSGIDYSYALDFGLPLKTTVTAVARGRVYRVISNASKVYRGFDHREAASVLNGSLVTTNQIVLCHPELGISTRYSHLDGQSIFVSEGEIVESGQVLGRTGLSGWVGPVPHLHFHAEGLRNGAPSTGKTLPFSIEGYPGPYEHAELMEALKETGLRWDEFFAYLLLTA